jgi:hypothetical protein
MPPGTQHLVGFGENVTVIKHGFESRWGHHGDFMVIFAPELALERIALGLSSGGLVVARDGEAERDRMI